jgi:hypothetical protein
MINGDCARDRRDLTPNKISDAAPSRKDQVKSSGYYKEISIKLSLLLVTVMNFVEQARKYMRYMHCANV